MIVGEYWHSNTSDFVKYMYIANKHIVKKNCGEKCPLYNSPIETKVSGQKDL